jgi:hypothetical protein
MGLCELVRTQQDEIVAEWALEARKEVPKAGELPGLILIDEMPGVLRELTNWLECGSEQDDHTFPSNVTRHALQRLGLDFNLGELVAEYAVLRWVVQRRIAGAECDPDDVLRFHAAIDAAITEAVKLQVERRERVAS